MLATLTDSTFVVYDTFVRPLSLSEKEEYYRESRAVARLFDIPDELIPPTSSDLTLYIEGMYNNGNVAVGDAAREVAQALFAPTLIGQAAYALSQASIGLLPERLREGYGFTWTPPRERTLQRLASASRKVRPHLPALFCVSPAALVAERRAQDGGWIIHSRP